MVYFSDRKYVKRLTKEYLKDHNFIKNESKMPSQNKSKETIPTQNTPTNETQNNSETKISKLEDRIICLEEYHKDAVIPKKHGKITVISLSIIGSILMSIGLFLIAAGSVLLARGSYPSGYGMANDSDAGFALFLFGLPFVIVGVRMIARA